MNWKGQIMDNTVLAVWSLLLNMARHLTREKWRLNYGGALLRHFQEQRCTKVIWVSNEALGGSMHIYCNLNKEVKFLIMASVDFYRWCLYNTCWFVIAVFLNINQDHRERLWKCLCTGFLWYQYDLLTAEHKKKLKE
jgi:hypothetical protein